MMLIMQIVLGLLGISFLVFIHEMGHLLVAKKAGVKVDSFSIGFGPKLFKKTWGDTEYSLSLIPLGGYVSMDGEHAADGRHARFHYSSKPIWVRAAILIAGPLVNLIFAFLVMWAIYMIGNPEEVKKALVVTAVEKNSPADKAGILSPDTILSIDGNKTGPGTKFGWEDASAYFAKKIGTPVKVEIGSKNGRRVVSIAPVEYQNYGIGYIGVVHGTTVLVVQEPEEGSSAHKAGIHKGDKLVSVDSLKIASLNDLALILINPKGKELTFTFNRSGKEVLYKSTPSYDSVKQSLNLDIELGANSNTDKVIVKRGVLEAAQKAVDKGYEAIVQTFEIIPKLFMGEIKVRALSGPVGVVDAVGVTWAQGIIQLFWLLAFVSLGLGALNLLPLVVTDGGQLVFLLVEWIRGRPLSQKVQGIISIVFMALFLVLMVYTSYYDVIRFNLAP